MLARAVSIDIEGVPEKRYLVVIGKKINSERNPSAWHCDEGVKHFIISFEKLLPISKSPHARVSCTIPL